jgi:hypothetical protein
LNCSRFTFHRNDEDFQKNKTRQNYHIWYFSTQMTVIDTTETATAARKKRVGRKPGSRNKHIGLCADATALGVTASYLWKWLEGLVTSDRMDRRWAEYKAEKPPPKQTAESPQPQP